MNNLYTPVSRKENLVLQDLNGEILIYDLSGSKAFCLNETAAFVWNLCDGKNTVGEIAGKLAEKTKSSANEEIVWLAIEQLKKSDLMTEADKLPAVFKGLDRREVIKRAALTTAVALPIVTGLVAPQAAAAQSVCSGACACGSGNNGVQAGQAYSTTNNGCACATANCRCIASQTITNGNSGVTGTCAR